MRGLRSPGLCAVTLAGVSSCAAVRSAPAPAIEREEIYVLRSIRERSEPDPRWCDRAGFEPLPKDAARLFSFWSLRARPADGRVVDAKVERVAELRGCFGGTSERTRQSFYAEIKLGPSTFSGRGECVAAMTDFPEAGLFPVRCQLWLSGGPPPYEGGLLTTNTLTSKAPFGGDSDPAGYAQASIATIRLWRRPVDEHRASGPGGDITFSRGR